MSDLNDRLQNITKKKNYELEPKIPDKNLLIEVTNKCNCNCLFCANSKMKRKRKNINPEFVERILNEAYDLGVREVGFYTTGESLLNDDLASYIKIAKTLGYKYVYLTTNGILLDLTKTKEIVSAGIDSIKLSINAINRDDYKFIHGVDLYDKVIDNLKTLYNYRRDNNLQFRIYVSYIATRYTDYNLDDIKDNFRQYCDEVAIVNVRNQSGLMPEVNKLLSCKEGKNKIRAERLVPCHYVFNTINVTCEGYLTACCTDFENYLAYADLNVVSLKEAWTNKLITGLRKKHLNNSLKGTLCDNCINNSLISPKPLSRKYIETDDLGQLINGNKVMDRLKKYKKED